MIRINGKRLLADLRELASIGGFKPGVDRVALSAKDIEARRWLVDKLTVAGLQASMDRVGNVLGRDPDAKQAILIGSHTDTVPKGGWLDGALGVGYALEIARSAIEANEPHATGVDAISFEDEEGTYMPFLGSRSFFADLGDADITAAKSKDGAPLAAALATIASEPPPHRFDPPRGAAKQSVTAAEALAQAAGPALVTPAATVEADMRRLAKPDTVWNVGNMI